MTICLLYILAVNVSPEPTDFNGIFVINRNSSGKKYVLASVYIINVCRFVAFFISSPMWLRVALL